MHAGEVKNPDERSLSACSVSSDTSILSEDSSPAVADGGHVNLAMEAVLQQSTPASVHVTSSSDVHVGPRLNYNAPVTINQYVTVGETGKPALSGVVAGGGGSPLAAKLAAETPWYRRRRNQCAGVAVLGLLAAIVAGAVLLSSPSEQHHQSASISTELVGPPPEDEPPDPQFMLDDGKRIYRRTEWGSVPPDFVRPLHHPTPYVVIGHTAGATCSGLMQCAELIRNYLDEHKSRWEQPDILYNFLVDTSGNVYEGRGWDATNGNQEFVLRCNLHVVLIGNFVNINVTSEMEESVKQLLELGVKLGKLSPDYRLLAHSQVLATLSPGKYALEAMRNWPHRCLEDCDKGVQCIYIDPNKIVVSTTQDTVSYR